jgi:2-aminoadipate transaminase
MQVALDAAREHLPGEIVRWTEPTGGYLIWVSLQEPEGDEALLEGVCQRHGVRISPGSYYFPGDAGSVHFRLSISMLDEGQIVEGIARLGRALAAYSREASPGGPRPGRVN